MADEVLIQGSVTDHWVFEFEADLDPGAYALPNGARVGLPRRGQLWPQRATVATFYRLQNDTGQAHYRVLLVPRGKDTYWLSKWLTSQAAESALTKIGTIMIGGLLGAAAAGIATVLVPGETAETLMWKENSNEGPVYGVTSGFNV
jgi:hypothetical protein